jgi:hypothetical protein
MYSREQDFGMSTIGEHGNLRLWKPALVRYKKRLVIQATSRGTRSFQQGGGVGRGGWSLQALGRTCVLMYLVMQVQADLLLEMDQEWWFRRSHEAEVLLAATYATNLCNRVFHEAGKPRQRGRSQYIHALTGRCLKLCSSIQHSTLIISRNKKTCGNCKKVAKQCK